MISRRRAHAAGFLLASFGVLACSSSRTRDDTPRSRRERVFSSPTIASLRRAIEVCSGAVLPQRSAFRIEVVSFSRLRLRIVDSRDPTHEGRSFDLELLPYFDAYDGTQTCDGKVIRMPRLAGDSLSELLDAADACTRSPPLNGNDRSGATLDWKHPIVHVQRRISVEYRELGPSSETGGIELVIDPTSWRCTPL